jgi:hypothetical protein
MGFCKNSIHALVSSAALFISVSIALPVFAQNSGDETSAVQTYVARTREISTSDYRIERRPDEDGLHVYRVSISPDVAGIAPAERVFDISVFEDGEEVLGESVVKQAD